MHLGVCARVCCLYWVSNEVFNCLHSANNGTIMLLTGGERAMMAKVGRQSTLTSGPRGMTLAVVGPSGVTNGMNISTQLAQG